MTLPEATLRLILAGNATPTTAGASGPVNLGTALNVAFKGEGLSLHSHRIAFGKINDTCSVILDTFDVTAFTAPVIGAAAIGHIDATANVALTSTLTIGGFTYICGNGAGEFASGGTASLQASLIASAINSGSSGAGHPQVTASAVGGRVNLTAKTQGAAGNSIGLSVTGTGLTRSAATLAGGVTAIPGVTFDRPELTDFEGRAIALGASHLALVLHNTGNSTIEAKLANLASDTWQLPPKSMRVIAVTANQSTQLISSWFTTASVFTAIGGASTLEVSVLSVTV